MACELKVHTLPLSHGDIHVHDSRPPEDDGKRPIIMLLHGNSFCLKIWRHIFESDLAKTHRIVAMDYPGHGDSSDARDPQVSYNMPGYADCALQVLEWMDDQSQKQTQGASSRGPRDVIVVGWSLGGHVAIEMVMRTKRIKGIVITGTPPVDSPDKINTAFTFGPGGWQEAYAARAKITEKELSVFAHNCANPPYEGWMLDCVTRTDGRARELMFKHFAEHKLDVPSLMFKRVKPYEDPTIGQQRCMEICPLPVLVINGRDEPFINLEWIDNVKFNNLWGGEHFKFDNCLHAPFWSKPEEYNKLLMEFVESAAGDGIRRLTGESDQTGT